jgi:type IV pilus assembly protein PilV
MRMQKAIENGYTLIEVLVALGILAIGLLGLAALQTTGLRFSHESYERTQAVIQTYDIIDRMRANRAPGASPDSTYDSVALGISTGTTDCSGGSACTSSVMAQYDIRQWNTTNAQLLPVGQGGICRGTWNSDYSTCTVSGSIYRIVLKWKEKDLDQYLEMESQL